MNTHHTGTEPDQVMNEFLIKLLGDILGAINQGAMLLDRNQRVVFANGHIYDMMSVSRLEEIEEIFLNNCPHNLLRKSNREGSTVTYLDLMLQGGKRSLLVGVNVYSLDLPHLNCGYVVMVNDFSNWRKLDEVQTRFATSISHRLRTPLTAAKNAISILSDDHEPVAPENRKKLLDIGWRNIEKLVSLFEELQKVFMIDSEEININQSLYRVDALIKSSLDLLKKENVIAGYTFRGEERSLITVKGAMKKFIRGAVEVYERLLTRIPEIKCSVYVDNKDYSAGDSDKLLKIRIKPVFCDSFSEEKGNLKDSLTYSEAHRKLFLDKIASSLGGVVNVYCDDSIVLTLPLAPPFDREKDVIQPLQAMIERGELDGGNLYMIKMKIVGMVDDPVFYRTVLQDLMIDILPEGRYLVSQGMKPLSWYIYIIEPVPGRLDDLLPVLRKLFRIRCNESGREVFPGIKWEIKYHRDFSCEERTDVNISDIEQFCR